MARAIWNGAISFGLVTIPVQLVSAVRSQRPRFHLLHAKDESPVHYERVCEREAKPVPWEQIVKGYEYEKGEYAVLTKEDFKRAALEKTDTIDILSFVPASAIDARYFETPYYVAPGKGADRAYALLRETDSQDRQGRRRAADPAAVAAPGGAVGEGRRLRADVAAAGGRSGGDGFDQDAEREGAARQRAAARGAAGRRPRGSVEAGAVQGSIRGEPVRDHRGEDQGQGGEAAPGRDRSGRAEGRGGGPDGAAAREPGRQHQRAREAAAQARRARAPPPRRRRAAP